MMRLPTRKGVIVFRLIPSVLLALLLPCANPLFILFCALSLGLHSEGSYTGMYFCVVIGTIMWAIGAYGITDCIGQRVLKDFNACSKKQYTIDVIKNKYAKQR